jgi:hypothetical protein
MQELPQNPKQHLQRWRRQIRRVGEVCACAVSLFVTHWLFVVVKPKLLTLPWFARAWARFVALRVRAWRWVGNRAGTLA